MKRTIVYFFGLLFLGVHGTAQIAGNYNADNESMGRQPLAQFIFQEYRDGNRKTVEENNIQGSPFLLRQFFKGTIYSSKGFEGEGVLRYDGYNDEVQLKVNLSDTTIVKLVQNKDIYCVLGREKIVHRSYYNGKDELEEGHLFELAETDTYVLFEKRAKKFKEGKAATTSFELPVASRFVLDRSTYCKDKKTDEIRMFKPTKKNVLNLFKSGDKEKYDDVKKFVSGSSLDFKKSKSIVQVFYFYNNL